MAIVVLSLMGKHFVLLVDDSKFSFSCIFRNWMESLPTDMEWWRKGRVGEREMERCEGLEERNKDERF